VLEIRLLQEYIHKDYEKEEARQCVASLKDVLSLLWTKTLPPNQTSQPLLERICDQRASYPAAGDEEDLSYMSVKLLLKLKMAY
jgi:hypothetical protein